MTLQQLYSLSASTASVCDNRILVKYSRPAKALEKSFESIVRAWEIKDFDNSLKFDLPGYVKRKVKMQNDHKMAMRFSIRH